jgi:hypothetical protein
MHTIAPTQAADGDELQANQRAKLATEPALRAEVKQLAADLAAAQAPMAVLAATRGCSSSGGSSVCGGGDSGGGGDRDDDDDEVILIGAAAVAPPPMTGLLAPLELAQSREPVTTSKNLLSDCNICGSCVLP